MVQRAFVPFVPFVPLVAFVAVLATSTAAHAIPYFGVHGEASAVAVSDGGVPETQTESGSPASDILSAEAASVGANDVATAGAIVGLDFLTTSADVSAGSFGSAVSTARYSGAFVNSDLVDLRLAFQQLNTASGSGASSTTLWVSLVSDGVSLFRDFVQASSWQYTYTPVVGTTSLLDIVLTSEASGAFLSGGSGNATAFGQVSVVPEASTWLMLSIGLFGVAAARSKRTGHALNLTA
jgi:hypothetical protein